MKVYLVIETVAYDGGSVVGCFSTFELARCKIESMINKDWEKYSDNQWNHGYIYLEIETHDLIENNI